MKGKAYILILLLLMVTQGATAASAMALNDEERVSFTQINWDAMPMDSVAPYYTEVVPLQTDYRRFTYSVALEYPQFELMTKAESQKASRFDDLIKETIEVESHVGVQRRQGMLDIAFLPIVRRNGHYEKLTSCRIIITATPLPGPLYAPVSGGRYAAHSRLAEGHWVKITIQEDGMYRLTRSALQSMGFTKPENVHLYGYGGHRQNEVITSTSHPDDLPEVPLFYAKGQDAWLFWGNGLLYWQGDKRIFNQYAREAAYFLRQEDVPSKIDTLDAVTGTPVRTVTQMPAHVLYEKDNFAWAPFGRNLYDAENFSSVNSRTYAFQTLNSAGDERLEISFSANATTETVVLPKVEGKEQANIRLSATGKYQHATVATKTYNLSSLQLPAAWNVNLTSTAGHDAHLDYLAVHYTRPISLHEGQAQFAATGSSVSRYEVTGSNITVMRLATPLAPVTLMSGQQEANRYAFQDNDSQGQYVAFNADYAFPQPTFAGYVANQDLHSVDSVDMVIIIPTSGKLRAQAERLAEVHVQHGGLRTVIVTAQQVYNEFSSGTPDATAYRRFLKMLYDRAEQDGGPRYLLLFGDCAWDNRMLSSSWTKSSPDDYLLCYESENSISSTASYVMEDYFALLDDGEGGNLLREKIDIGVGRMPVTTATQAEVVVDKIVDYLEGKSADSWRNLVCVLGDDGDNNGHMTSANKVADNVIHNQPTIDVQKVMWDAYDRTTSATGNSYPQVTNLLRKRMVNGAAVINYMGHANADALSHEFVLRREDFMTNKTDRLGLWVTAACDVMPIDGTAENIGETAILAPSAGAMAFFGTTRTVYATENEHINVFFMQYLFQRDSQGKRNTIGDAIRLAKNAMITAGKDGAHPENKIQYVLLGDPAIAVAVPDYRVVLDSISGQTPDKVSLLRAGELVRFKGHVEDGSQQLTTDFSGVVSLDLYDNEYTVTCHNNAGAEKPFQFQTRKLIIQSRDSVQQGEFNFSFVVPVDINYSGKSARAVFYAFDADANREATGYDEQFALGEVDPAIKRDSVGPEMYIYLNSPDFQDGGRTNSTPYLVAELEDESGISVSGNGIGHDIELIVDGLPSRTYTLNDYYTAEFGDFRRGTVAFSIPYLENGPHTLLLRAWDVLNNVNQKQLSFIVDDSLQPAMSINASQNPAVSNTTFLVATNFPGTTCRVIIDVFDFMGRQLWRSDEVTTSSNGIFSIPWNLCADGGGRLGTGIYLYRATVLSGSAKEVTKAQKLVVISNK